MLQDTITLAAGASVIGFQTESGTAFPSSPVDGQKFRLTAATATYEAGEYSYNLAATEWQNSLVLIAKNNNFTATGKIGSNVSVNASILVTASGAAFPGSPTDGQKFRLTAATATHEAGEYTYNLAATEWQNTLVMLGKSASFAATGKIGSVVALNQAAIAYDIGMQILGKPDAGAVVGRFVAVRAFKLPAAFAGSNAKSSTAATASTALSVKKNGTQVGTVTFAAAGTTGALAAAAETSFAIGDVLTLTAAGTQDATFADAEFTFVAALV